MGKHKKYTYVDSNLMILSSFTLDQLYSMLKLEFSINFNLETTQLSTFFLRTKKGSKKYRKILSKEKISLHNNKGLRNCNLSTDQIIRKPIPQYDFELYATDRAFNMLINFSTIRAFSMLINFSTEVKNMRQSEDLHFFKIFYL